MEMLPYQMCIFAQMNSSHSLLDRWEGECLAVSPTGTYQDKMLRAEVCLKPHPSEAQMPSVTAD